MLTDQEREAWIRQVSEAHVRLADNVWVIDHLGVCIIAYRIVKDIHGNLSNVPMMPACPARDNHLIPAWEQLELYLQRDRNVFNIHVPLRFDVNGTRVRGDGINVSGVIDSRDNYRKLYDHLDQARRALFELRPANYVS